jgi:hypothetical protein
MTGERGQFIFIVAVRVKMKFLTASGKGSTMRRSVLVLFSVVVFAFFAFAVMAAKGGKPGGGGAEPCAGNPISVLVTDDCGLSMRVEVRDSANACAIQCWLNEKNKRKCTVFVAWIGGIVVEDATKPLGFYFDPNTVEVAEVTEEGSQTTLCAISSNPPFFASDPTRKWWVTANLSDLQEL